MRSPHSISGGNRRSLLLGSKGGLLTILALSLVAFPSVGVFSADATPKKDSKAQTNSVPKVIQIPKSVFTSDPANGKDPFFPDSTRRNPRAAKPSGDSSNTNLVRGPQAVPAKKPAPDLVLQGLAGSKSQRLGLINGRTFAAGESGTIVITNGVSLRLKCIEIRPRSVIVQVDGEASTRELKLRGE